MTAATGRAPRRTEATTTGDHVDPLASRYDLLLVLVPIAFLAAVLAGFVLPVGTRPPLAGAALVGLAAIVDGVYRNPPIPER